VADKSRSVQDISGLTFGPNDSVFTFPRLDKFIEITLAPNQQTAQISVSEPNCVNMKFNLGAPFANTDRLSNEQIGVYLASVQEWVASELSEGSPTDTSPICSCLRIHQIAQHYRRHSRRYYANNPETWSVMILTLLDMFIICEKMACQDVPLPEEYSLEILSNAFETLLLARRSQLSRLEDAESYLSDRSKTRDGQWRHSSLQGLGKPDSLPVRYAGGSDCSRAVRSSSGF
jgi:hypothetical protein